MAQSGYTPILIYASGTTGNTPSASNLTSSASGSELALNYFDGKLFYKDASGNVQVLATKGGVGSSTTTQVLYNSSGLVVGSANMTFDGSTLTTLNSAYTGTLTGGTGIVNLGSGQFYKDASGNVGIGTSSPAYKLDVNGVTNATCLKTSGSPSGGFAANSWFIQNEAANIVRAYACGTNASSFGSFTEYTATSTGNAVPARFYDNVSHIWYTNNAERMRIDSSGNLLVGETSLYQPGGVSISKLSNGANSSGNIFFNSAGTSNYPAIFQYNGSNVGYITYTNTTVSYVSLSDYRLKENIAPMTGALNKISALKPVTYNWKADGSDGQGFIAHELQEVVPDCVTGEKDAVDAKGNPVYQGIDTSFLVATLTAAIQEQQALITDLQTRLTKAGL
jgi:hypothetical protein